MNLSSNKLVTSLGSDDQMKIVEVDDGISSVIAGSLEIPVVDDGIGALLPVQWR
jgi:hypothetical protein